MSHLNSLFEGNLVTKNQAWDALRLKLLTQNHQEVFGKLSTELKVTMVRNGVVEVKCRNPVWVNEITRLKKMLLEKMNTLLGKNGRLLDIKVIFDSAMENDLLKEEKLPLGLSLEEKIRLSNEMKVKRGLKLCKKCEEIYTAGDCCVFCRTTL